MNYKRQTRKWETITFINILLILFTIQLYSTSFNAQAKQKAELYVQTGHTENVNSVAFSPDGKLLASGSDDKTIKLWDVASGRELDTLSGSTEDVNSVTFSPDGKLLASAGEGDIKFWDVDSGKELKTLSSYTTFANSIAFSPDGNLLASGGLGDIRLWDVASGKEFKILLQLRVDDFESSVESVAFSPDGKTLVSAGGADPKTINFWDVNTGQKLRTFKGHKDLVKEVAFSPDGKLLVSVSMDKTIKLWDVASEKELKTLSSKSSWGDLSFVYSIAFSPDGKLLASGGSSRVDVWNVASGKNLKTLSGQYSVANSVTFSPDGKLLASGTGIMGVSESGEKTLNLWDVASGKKLKTLSGHVENAKLLAFSPDGKMLASASFKNIKLWDFASGQKLKTLSGSRGDRAITSIAFSPNGKLLASGGHGKTKLWDVVSGKELKTLLSDQYSFVNSVTFSPNGKLLVSESERKTISLWDVATGRELRTLSGYEFVFSPDGKTFAFTTVGENAIKLWDTVSYQELTTLSNSSGDFTTRSVAFSPDGKLLARGSSGQTIKLWDINSGRELRKILGHTRWVESVAFSPDGQTLASGSLDETIKLWDVFSGKQLKSFSRDDPKTFGEVSNTVPDLYRQSEFFAITTYGESQIRKGENGKLDLYNAKTGKLLVSLIALDENEWVIASPDGRFDTNKPLDKVDGLHWIYDGQILNPLPLHIFMRQYYEPGLLQRTVKCTEANNCDGEFKSLPSISDINRVQPKVSRPQVSSVKANGTVDVMIEIENLTGEITRGDKEQNFASGVYDLRLFRDDQLVGTSTPKDKLEKFVMDAPGFVAEARKSKESLDTPEDEAWREANDIFTLETGNIKYVSPTKAVYTFKNIKLPKDYRRKVEFSTYAFNSDRVKSNTRRTEYNFKPLEIRNGNMYFISIGVNASENPIYNLNYAANDAREMQDVLGEKLKAKLELSFNSKLYQIPLISDFDAKGNLVENTATKPIIKSVFGLLGGNSKQQIIAEIRKLLREETSKDDDPTKQSAEEIFKQIPIKVGDKLINPENLPPIEPEDTLIISFSGHGYADQNGIFYILPYDVGKDTLKLTPEVLPNLISSDELSLWMRDVTAKEMVMIIDACHSAAAVQGDGFKPGPMGSRGLGQLAYDKGMKILSATQADNIALELESIKQGLLSYALLQDGIVGKKADIDEPKDAKLMSDEWLRYAEGRVGNLYEEIKNGSHILIVNNKSVDGQARSDYVAEAGKKRNKNVQVPKLFDFRRDKPPNLLIDLE